jgi:hypothetical protein
MKYLLTLLIVLLIPTASLAKGECKEERKKFCAGMVKKQLWHCLSKHEAVLGAPCKTKIEARAKAKEERAAVPSAAPGANYHHLQRTPSRSQWKTVLAGTAAAVISSSSLVFAHQMCDREGASRWQPSAAVKDLVRWQQA